MALNMDHIVLNVVDIEEMLSFYTEVLNLPGERVDEYRAGAVPFPSVRVTKDTIIDLFPRNLWMGTTPPDVGRPNLNHFCLAADRATWDQLRTGVHARGIPVEDGPVRRWGAHGTGVSIYFRDPERNLIEVRYYETPDMDDPCLLGS